MTFVYLPHFDPPYKHAQHYCGYTSRDEVQERVAEHQRGEGSVLCRAARRAGCTITLARVWEDVPRRFELRLKKTSQKKICPICSPGNKRFIVGPDGTRTHEALADEGNVGSHQVARDRTKRAAVSNDDSPD